jgi:hypothetical protein
MRCSPRPAGRCTARQHAPARAIAALLRVPARGPDLRSASQTQSACVTTLVTRVPGMRRPGRHVAPHPVPLRLLHPARRVAAAQRPAARLPQTAVGRCTTRAAWMSRVYKQRPKCPRSTRVSGQGSAPSTLGAAPARSGGWKAAAEATTAEKTAALVYIVSAMGDAVFWARV